MRCHIPTTVIVVVGLIGFCPPAGAQGLSPVRPDIALSPEVRELLLAEMREIAGGVQAVALALASADWAGIEATSARIRASYILELRLSDAQRRELERALPEGFKQRDQEFHERAARLGAAAVRRDPELVAFQYSRLLESCAACHAAYAPARFPGFASDERDAHRH